MKLMNLYLVALLAARRAWYSLGSFDELREEHCHHDDVDDDANCRKTQDLFSVRFAVVGQFAILTVEASD